MSDNTRKRSGKIILLLLALLVASLYLATSDELTGSESDKQRTTIITSIFNRVTGKNNATIRGTRTRKTAPPAKKAEEPAAQAAASNAGTSTTLTGVTRDENGNPLAGVKITVRQAGRVEAIKSADSAADGRFTLDSLPADTYDVLANHDKFIPLIRPSFTIRPQDETVAIDFTMPLGANINGLIVNEEDQPLPNVRVAARRQKVQESKENGQVLLDDSTYHTQITDTPGTFTLAGISLGNNVFEFVVPGYAMERTVVDITPEKAAEQMKVVMKRTGIISGSVVDENNNPVSTATVSLTRYKPLKTPGQAIDKGKMVATTDAEGKFKFEKLYNEGYYDLLVEEAQFAPGIYPLVPVNSDRVNCTLGIGGQIAGFTQMIDRETTEISVLVKATAVIKGTTFTQETTSDGKGRFSFGKLPYGAYSLNVDDGKYVSEPRDGVVCERDKPAKDVPLELFEIARAAGRVSDNASDAPVAGAKITLQSTYGLKQDRKKTYTVYADSHGIFDFSRIPSGIHVAQAEARGYLKGNTQKTQQSFVLVPGERKSDLNLYLDHGASVEGFVLDPDGRSVADVDIQLFQASQADGGIDISKLKGKTDDTGYFKIWGIEVGDRVQLYASASKKGYTKTLSDMVEITPEQMDQTVQINMSRGGTITGIVTDQRKMPIPGAEIRFDSSAFPGDPSPSNLIVHTNPNGTYRIENCPPGGAGLTVSRAGFVKQGRGVTVRNSTTSDNINFELEIGNVIAGVVEDLDGNPIAGATVQASGLNGAAGSESDTTDKKGKFELKNLGKGEFKLTATFKIKTQEGEQGYTFVTPRIASGTAHANIDCDLANSTSGRVEGEKGKGLQNFTVVLNSRGDTKPSQDFVFNLGRGMTNAGGFFRMSKLPRGLYKMTVTADGYEPYVEEDVVIGPGRRTVLPQVRMNPAGGVIGRIYSNTSDRPVNNASVRLESVSHLKGESATVIGGTTNMRGEFRVSTVPEGLYRVNITHPSYIGMKMDMIHVTEKKERDLGKLFLEPGGIVRGTVRNHLGDTVPGMTVTVKGVTPVKQATTDAAGNYIIQGVQFGNWPVVVQGTMMGKPMYSFQAGNIERDATERLDFLLETTSNVKGSVLASAETGLHSAGISIHAFDENNAVLENVKYSTHTSSNQYAINEVPPGQYFMWLNGQGSAGTLKAWKNIFLNRGHNNENITVSAARVQGQVTDGSGQPVANANIQIMPLFNAPNITRNLYNKLVHSAVTDANGQFSFYNLQQGAWQILNQSPATGGWYAQPSVSLNRDQQLNGVSLVLNE